jgi:cytochrome b
LVGFIPHLVLIVMDVYHIAALIIYSVFVAVPILATIIWGEGNFNRFKITGPY